eukprot:m.10711 g.10711  ORF g.10711 m.10711 type:complete len:641 (-) comp5296_c0_seq1:1696-3618(-)
MRDLMQWLRKANPATAAAESAAKDSKSDADASPATAPAARAAKQPKAPAGPPPAAAKAKASASSAAKKKQEHNEQKPQEEAATTKVVVDVQDSPAKRTRSQTSSAAASPAKTPTRTTTRNDRDHDHDQEKQHHPLHRHTHPDDHKHHEDHSHSDAAQSRHGQIGGLATAVRENDAAEDVKSEEEEEKDEAMDYEKIRLQNIEANNRLLQQLGLLAGGAALPGMSLPTPQPRSSAKKTARPAAKTPSLPRRASARLAQKPSADMSEEGLEALAAATAAAAEEEAEAEEEPEEMPEIGSAFAAPTSKGSKGAVFASTQHLLDSKKALLCTGHRHVVYSMHHHEPTDLLAAGGKEGIVSVFSCNTHVPDLTQQPLVVAKAHKRWICDVQFVDLVAGKQHLLTASDDRSLILSELRNDHNAYSIVPLDVRSNLHGGGIFSMEAHRNQVLTGSKDGSVAVCALAADSVRLQLKIDDVSDTVIKCTTWKPDTDTIFGAVGNDRAIRFYDVRTKSKSSELEEAHSSVIASLVFAPESRSTNEFFTSSFDKSIKVWDYRALKTPVCTFVGHHQPGGGRSSLTSPIYYKDLLLTIGDNSPFLTLYNIDKQTQERKVYIGFTPTNINAVGPVKLAAAHGSNAIWTFLEGV